MTKVGFIGLGNVGGKLAGSLIRNGIDVVVRDLDRAVAQPFLDDGAAFAESPAEMARACDIIITCLPLQLPVPQSWKPMTAFLPVCRRARSGPR